MIKKELKILDFKSGEPRLSPEAYQRDLIQRIWEVAERVRESRAGQANWVIYTGVEGANLINQLNDT